MTPRRPGSFVGPMVPLERAAGTERLPALDPKRAKNTDLARKFKAVISGKRLTRRPPAIDDSQSKYEDED